MLTHNKLVFLNTNIIGLRNSAVEEH